MNTPDQPKQWVDKIGTVERQLDTAIWLWFHSADLVSINTLADAAIGVLDDLYPKLKKERPVPFNPKHMPEGITTVEVRKAREKIREAGAFAKLARWDADLAYEYNPMFTEQYLYCAILALIEAGYKDDAHGLRNLFSFRYGMMHPRLFDPRLRAYQLIYEGVDIERLSQLSRIEFLRECGGWHFIGNPPRPE